MVPSEFFVTTDEAVWGPLFEERFPILEDGIVRRKREVAHTNNSHLLVYKTSFSFDSVVSGYLYTLDPHHFRCSYRPVSHPAISLPHSTGSADGFIALC